jgi:predicted TIM-barrel fold metal-dependent hydrolase
MLPPLLLALRVVGSDDLLFSVDYPFVLNVPGRELRDSLSTKVLMNEQSIAKFVHGNAEKLLKVHDEADSKTR